MDLTIRKLLIVIITISLVILILLAIVSQSTSDHCKETVCGSIVSKCQLIKKCNCDSNTVNATCTMECFKCLDYLYLECCSCVDVCPKMNSSANLFLSSQSHVEDLSEPMPLLFNTITEEEDPLQRWTLETFPVRMSFVTTGKEGEITASHHHPYVTKITTGDALDRQEDVTMNCTVVYMSDCMPYNKCKSSCTSMGASSYRWFHDGCCECVGPHCINYGMNESKCLLCPLDNSKEDALMRVDNGKATGTASTGKSDGEMSTGKNLSPAIENKVTHHSVSPSSGSGDSLDYEIGPPEPEEAPKEVTSSQTADINKDKRFVDTPPQAR